MMRAKVNTESFGRDPNDYFMLSLRRRINHELRLNLRKQLLFWSWLGKLEAVVVSALLISQGLILQRNETYQRQIQGLLKNEEALTDFIASLKAQLDRTLESTSNQTRGGDAEIVSLKGIEKFSPFEKIDLSDTKTLPTPPRHSTPKSSEKENPSQAAIENSESTQEYSSAPEESLEPEVEDPPTEPSEEPPIPDDPSPAYPPLGPQSWPGSFPLDPFHPALKLQWDNFFEQHPVSRIAPIWDSREPFGFRIDWDLFNSEKSSESDRKISFGDFLSHLKESGVIQVDSSNFESLENLKVNNHRELRDVLKQAIGIQKQGVLKESFVKVERSFQVRYPLASNLSEPSGGMRHHADFNLPNVGRAGDVSRPQLNDASIPRPDIPRPGGGGLEPGGGSRPAPVDGPIGDGSGSGGGGTPGPAGPPGDRGHPVGGGTVPPGGSAPRPDVELVGGSAGPGR